METRATTYNNRKQITELVNTMSREDMAWTIKFITDKMLIFTTPSALNDTVRPSWWNKPLLNKTLSLMPKQRADLGEDYKEQLSDILEEKYL